MRIKLYRHSIIHHKKKLMINPLSIDTASLATFSSVQIKAIILTVMLIES